MVSCAYYLTIAEVAGLSVNRDAAIAPVVMFLTFMSVVFRLEVINFDDPNVAFATCIFQGVLEIILRLTVVERDALLKAATRRICVFKRKRRATTLIVSFTGTDPPPPHTSPPALALFVRSSSSNVKDLSVSPQRTSVKPSYADSTLGWSS